MDFGLQKLRYAILLAACVALALPRVSAECNSQCSYYASVTGQSNITTSPACLLDCANCLAANPGYTSSSSNSNSNKKGAGFMYFSPSFNQAGAYVGSTCSNSCDDQGLPPWAILAISLGSLAILGVIACATFGFVLRYKRLSVEALRIKHRQELPSNASVAIPMPPGDGAVPVPAGDAKAPGVPPVKVEGAEPCVGYPAAPHDQNAKLPLMYPMPGHEYVGTTPAGYPAKKGHV